MVRAANERTYAFYIGCTAWLLAVVALVYIDLGVIGFVGSVLLAIWVFGLREKFDSEDTASAYSVFNKKGKAIAGGFTAAQFEQQMRGGANPNTSTMDDNVGLASANNTNRQVPTKIGNSEKLRRRQAAAAAAERRSAVQQ
eukprot:scaffold380892_cov57-Attheya_sp.AAC.4